jgi:hypothetical protein
MTALVRYTWPTAAAASLAVLGNSNVAQAAARTQSVSSGGWIALAIIAFLVWAIYLLIRGALTVERRGYRDHGWFGILPQRDDNDGPGFHPHDGGEGGL